MTRNLTILGFVALSACAVPIPDLRGTPTPAVAPAPEVVAPVTPLSAKERFVSLAEVNGCVVNADNSADILTGATLSQEDLARILSELQAEGRGRVAPDGQSFIVTAGACA